MSSAFLASCFMNGCDDKTASLTMLCNSPSADWGGDQWSGSEGKELQGLPQSGRWEQTHFDVGLECSTLGLRRVYLEYVDYDSGLRFCCARPSELKDFQLMEGSIDREYQVLCHGFWSRVACCVSSCSPILERFSQRMHRWSYWSYLYLFGKLLATTPVGVVTWLGPWSGLEQATG